MESSMKNIEIYKNVYWVGTKNVEGGLNCNSYLLVEDDEAVLFDPGSVLDIEEVYKNILDIISLEKIKYVVLHHQDPDFCSGVPFLEKQGGNFKIITHWRTQELVKYYGIKSDYYLVNENKFEIMLKSGRLLKFIMTPYLHFPGAITTYDEKSKILFSSDLFGAISTTQSLYAGDDYLEKMKTFHEHYMPSNDILRPIMEIFMQMDIDMIVPQHGSIINKDVKKYIKTLRELECGTFLSAIKKNIKDVGGYAHILGMVIKRYSSIFHKDEVLKVVEELNIELEEDTFEIKDYNYSGKDLWNILFEAFYAQKGIRWITVIEPFVKRLCNEYELPLPEVFKSTLKKAEEQSEHLDKENKKLKEIVDRLNKRIEETEQKLTRCPITGLYNDNFFRTYLNTEINNIIQNGSEFNPALMIIGIDNMEEFRFLYGDHEVEEIFKGIAYLLNGFKEEDNILFRLQGATFACYLPDSTKQAAVKFAEKIRNAVEISELFIAKTTVSIGVVDFEEISEDSGFIDRPEEVIKDIGMMRLKIARKMGRNLVCSSSEVMGYKDSLGKILIADTDPVNLEVLRKFIENMHYEVITAGNGEEILSIVEREHINLIITELMIPKIDGFLVRERLSQQSNTKNIPFIITSYLKNEDSVKRAASLKIDYYLKKPYIISELLGIIKNKVKGD